MFDVLTAAHQAARYFFFGDGFTELILQQGTKRGSAATQVPILNHHVCAPNL
jgi:hypothetical protein